MDLRKTLARRLLPLLLALVMGLVPGALAEDWRNSDLYPLESDKVFRVVNERTTEVNGNYFDQLLQEYIGLDIDWLSWTNEQLRMAMAAGDIPDASYRTWLDKATVYEFGSAGKLVNFMDYLDIMPNLRRAWEVTPDAQALATNEDGTVYALPGIGISATTPGNLIYLRQDMREKAGWDRSPETTEEFLQCILDIQAAYGEDEDFIAFLPQHANAMNWNNGAVPQFFFPSFGALLKPNLNVLEDGTVVLGAATEQWRYYVEYMARVYQSGAFMQSIYEEDGNAVKGLLAANHGATGSFMTLLTEENFESGIIELEVLKPLTSEYYDQMHWYQTPSITWRSVFVSADCADIEAMCKWIDALFSTRDNPLDEEGTVWGISPWIGKHGVDFLLNDEDNTYVVFDHEGYSNGANWMNSEGLNSYYTNGGAPFLYYEANGSALAAKALGAINNLFPYAEPYVNTALITLTPDEQDDYNDVWADLSTYIAESTAAFITGAKGIDAEWDAYLANLEKMGLSTVYSIYEGAYARFIQ